LSHSLDDVKSKFAHERRYSPRYGVYYSCRLYGQEIAKVRYEQKHKTASGALVGGWNVRCDDEDLERTIRTHVRTSPYSKLDVALSKILDGYRDYYGTGPRFEDLYRDKAAA
jgi:hypothetical protein